MLPVLLDLGVAAPAGEMAVAGTPMYFAPEVAQRFVDGDCDAPLTAKSDVFALALSALYSMVAPGDDLRGLEFEAFVRRRATEPVALPDSSQLRGVRDRFKRWLHAESVERPSAAELADELGQLARRAQPVTVSDHAGPVLMGSASPSRWIVPVGIAMIGLVTLGWGLGAAFRSNGPSDSVRTTDVAEKEATTSSESESESESLTAGDAQPAKAIRPVDKAQVDKAMPPVDRSASSSTTHERRVQVLQTSLEVAHARAAELERELSAMRNDRSAPLPSAEP